MSARWRRAAALAAAGWSLALLGVGSIPAEALAVAPRVWDKLAHAVGYGLFGALAALALAARLRGGALIAAATGLAVAVGGLDELHQRWVPGRACDLADLLADGLGALVAAVVVERLMARRAPAAPAADERSE